MIDFFYGLPIWAATVLVLGTALGVGLGSSFGLKRLLKVQTSDDEMETAVSLMQVVAAYIGILIAFAAVEVWQDFADAENASHRETAAAAELYRDLSTYGPEMEATRKQLRLYVTSIVINEWPLLPHGKASEVTEAELVKLFNAMGKIHPKDNRDTAIYAESFSNLNELVELRRDRLIHSESGMPMILWIVGLVGSMLIVSYTATFRRSRTNLLMIAGMSVALGLMFLFILIVDRPFMGQFSISSQEYADLDRKFNLLDRLSKDVGQAP